ncbi:TIGR03086 family protein [Micromonospora sp. WP24]|uniref:TIGR03086 family metal-binding protein n=1 Tax=Micromonospora sp. WP24 TaxID=2604469 RepID=UPI0011D418A0|nr:TIGR03086 family metal-binding protein [Micromonospora sp. WP24]TYB97394.1 TIGR03086 family protein [Micromonospora sp. WP24]
MDLLESYRRSLADFIDRVERVSPRQWSARTPCSDWDVRTLVNHVVGEARWSVPLLAGRTIAEVGDRFDGDQLGDEPITAARDAASQAEIAAFHPGTLERTVHLSSGDVPASEYLHQLLAEHLVHGWDLTVAIGDDSRLDTDAVRECARWFTAHVGDYQSAGLTHPGVDPPVDADDQDRLIAAFGRDPRWTPAG